MSSAAPASATSSRHDAESASLWDLVFGVRTAVIIGLAVLVPVVALLGDERLLAAVLLLLFVLPYNLWLWSRARRTGRPPAAMVVLDSLLPLPFGLAFPTGLTVAALTALANLSIHVIVFGRRIALRATLVAAAGFIGVAAVFARSDLGIELERVAWATATGFLVLGPSLVVIVDAVQRRRLRANDRLADVLDSADAVVFEYDRAERRFRFMHGPVERMMGHRPEDLMGGRDVLAHLVPLEDMNELRAALDDPTQGGEVEYRLATSEGEQRWMRSRMTLVPGGAAGRVRGVTVNVTDRKRGEVERAELERRLAADAHARAAVQKLEEAVRPAPMEMAGAEIAAFFLPADETVPTGGDLYDWQVLPDGDLHLVVVDVMGKGVDATRDAIGVIHTLRTLVSEGFPLAEVVRRADPILTSQNPELVATCLVGRYNPVLGELHLAGGGHPPVVAVDVGGRARVVPAPGIPIGWPGAGSDAVVTLQLAHDEVVVLYTDGVIEARRDLIVGLQELEADLVDLRRLPVAELAERLVRGAVERGERRDDSLALVLRRQPAEVRSWASSTRWPSGSRT